MSDANKRKCEVEVFSRVTGFFRPVRDWNPGKQSEFADRKTFNLAGAHVQAKEEPVSTEEKGV